MQFLLQLLQKNKAVEALLAKKGLFVVDDCEGISLLVATAYFKKKESYTIIAKNLYHAQKIYEGLSVYVGEDNCLFFPVDEMLRVEAVSASKEMLAQRLYVMYEALHQKDKIIITHVSALTRFLPDPRLFSDRCLTLRQGMDYDLEKIRDQLIKMGYERVNKIDQSLQFAIRGYILDVYSVNGTHPVRIEFFDNEIESIRCFDIATQRSIEGIEEIAILPASDLLFIDTESQQIETKLLDKLEKQKEFLKEDMWQELHDKVQNDLQLLRMSRLSPTLYRYYGFLQDAHFSLLDYIKDTTIIMVDYQECRDIAEMTMQEEADYYVEMQKEGEILKGLEMHQDFNKMAFEAQKVIKTSSFASHESDNIFNVRPIVGDFTYQNARSLLESYYDSHKHILIFVSTKQQQDAISELITNNNWPYEIITNSLPKVKIGLMVYPIEAGFELVDESIVVLTSHELFGYRNRMSRFLNRYKEAVILKSFEDLTPGDYVVHEQNGIGQFIGIITLEVDGVHRDYLHIKYAGTDVLYVPLDQFKLVRKFVGKEGICPKLNHLGSTEWEKTKRKIRDRVNDIAEGLIKLYAERSAIKGFAFNQDDDFQRTFEAQFPFELTKDQAQSLIEIKEDMEKPFPMDRLLCGDVGFGKTEIAFRAAFKAILSGKQVALLCPTTLLARQHYERALERFGPFGVKIAILSRLVPDKTQKNYIEKIKTGEIHLVIGTHRILSKEVEFFDLGFLIIDEEQRFGVKQKEEIKKIKKNIDVLTLTATPIPRTLQMSLVGIRQFSQLNTPPINRMPIQTYVIPQKDTVVKELIERELARQGQVFYLHNQVSTIYQTARKIQAMVPKARIGVVHGQMDRDIIEDTMLQFYHAEIDVLICTSIIEIGIDIANANMMIIENADHFGLSQLYQIKGRVGRGNRIAYAYLMYRQNKELTEIAQKRLRAIQEFTELGSGYRIAQRDLMIRGAGDILGAEQAGFIDTVGIDMYLQLLNEVVQNKQKKEDVLAEPQPPKTLTIDAYIPSEYASDSDKIELYQEIESTADLASLEQLRHKTRDIYGRIPQEVVRLFLKRKIDFYLQENYFSDMKENKDAITLKISPLYSRIDGIGMQLFRGLSSFLSTIKVTFNNFELRMVFYKKGEWLERFVQFLEKIIEVLKPYNEN